MMPLKFNQPLLLHFLAYFRKVSKTS